MNRLLAVMGALGAWEMFWWADRVRDRHQLYDRAKAHARALGLPLIVVGAPDQGPTPGPGCGDLTLDILPTACPCSMQVDITRPIPIPSDSSVVFVSCVLEYVQDFQAAWRELQRIAPNRVYVCRVQPWTLTGQLYPGAKRCLDKQLCEPRPDRFPTIRLSDSPTIRREDSPTDRQANWPTVRQSDQPTIRDPSWLGFLRAVVPSIGGVVR